MRPTPPTRQVRIVVAATALLSFMSVWKAAALALAELGIAAFFVTGLVEAAVGPSGAWFVLAACLLGALVRAIDVESWAVFVPGGFTGRVAQAFGPRAASVAAAAVLVERLLLAALACTVIGEYTARVALPALSAWHPAWGFADQELTAATVVVVVGVLWLRARIGTHLEPDTIARWVWVGVGTLVLTTAWAVVTGVDRGVLLSASLPVLPGRGTGPVPVTLATAFALALALPTVGGGDRLAQAAHQFSPPRVRALRHTALLVVLFTFVATAIPAFLFGGIVPGAERQAWQDAPVLALAHHLAAPPWMREGVAVAVVIAAFLMLVPATRAALTDATQVILRQASDRVLPAALALPHRRFGTPARAIDLTAAATLLVTLLGAGQVSWLGRAYAFALACGVLLKAATLLRLRRTSPAPRRFKVAFNLRLFGRELPLGLGLALLLAAACLGALLLAFDFPSLFAAALLLLLTAAFAARTRRVQAEAEAPDLDAFELLSSTALSVDQVEARPGNLLVAVRNPYALAHLDAAFRAAAGRDLVVMTARLLGVDSDDDSARRLDPTPAERRLFSRVVALAEQHALPVRLLIVPAPDVFDAVVATVVRLRSSEVYVGEAASLAVDEQARLFGEAWEDATKPADLKARLVIHHHSGRTDAYHLGAHPPTLNAVDIEQIHRLWLDAVKGVGPHVHHHDIVRAALTLMENQLSGPEREKAVSALRQVARPADELAAAVSARDFSRLRDITRNRHASDLALALTELSLEDQVVAFRVLPRKDAAAVFEYLSLEQQEALLKGMAQEDVAALLNHMAPDDRTMFLEELPASATRQLLSLLTPDERAVALTLLGYPEDSVGRLMTPEYVRVREHWSVREVFDHIRQHGEDSETLNVIYVIDQQGMLIDDIRLRELLLTALDTPVADLMDRRFVALKATDDQQTAVAAFRRFDRTALPVTDTAGMLIGIVTVDDVLDVAEATATKEIQRIGGSEALDEPYMAVGFGTMIRKRAGWLTVLFLGEMLTATAMGAFEAEIARAVVLALFVPLIISSGGNSGSQASTLVIRALALGEVTLRDWWRVMRREVLAGLTLGAILGTIGFLRITVWSAFSAIYGPHWLLVAITVASALLGVVMWGTLVGSLLPFLLRRLGFDPAASSAPFVATLVDVTGLVIYFSVAHLMLRGALL
jgi:magnesium transporter